MNKLTTDSTNDTDGPTVYVAAYVSHRLYQLLTTEAEEAGVSRSRMIDRVLAERYGKQQKGESSEEHAGRRKNER